MQVIITLFPHWQLQKKKKKGLSGFELETFDTQVHAE